MTTIDLKIHSTRFLFFSLAWHSQETGIGHDDLHIDGEDDQDDEHDRQEDDEPQLVFVCCMCVCV